jgi:glutamate carboxypeptidase
MNSRIVLFLITSAISLSKFDSFGQKLTKPELAIVKSVEKNHAVAVKFLESTININSGTYNTEGVKKVGAVYQKMLDDMGFTTSWVDMPASMRRGGHLVAEIKGTKGKRILLNSHMDTVFDLNSPFQKWTVKDSIASGPGTNDTKGGIMIMLYALRALYETGQLKDRQIVVIIHGDEESAGSPIEISRKDLVDAAKRSDVALCFETGKEFNSASVARRAGSGWTLKVTAKQSHSGQIFSEKAGPGAIYETARILNRFQQELKEKYLTFSPGIMVAGVEADLDSTGLRGTAFGKSNIVATTSVVKGDLRYISVEQLNRAREKMRTIVKEGFPHTEAEILFTGGSQDAMPPTEGNIRLLGILSKASQDLGQGPVTAFDPALRGGGDMTQIAKYLDIVDGLGAIGGNSHSPEEYINLNYVKGITKRTAVFIHRLSN